MADGAQQVARKPVTYGSGGARCAIEIAEELLQTSKDNTDLVRHYGTIATGILIEKEE